MRDIKPNCCPLWSLEFLFFSSFSVGHLVRHSNIFCQTSIKNVRLSDRSDEFRQHWIPAVNLLGRGHKKYEKISKLHSQKCSLQTIIYTLTETLLITMYRICHGYTSNKRPVYYLLILPRVPYFRGIYKIIYIFQMTHHLDISFLHKIHRWFT